MKRETACRRELTLDDVYEAIGISFEIPKDQFLSQSRWSRLTEARGAAAVLVKDIPHLSLTSLCRSLGCSISSMSHLTRRVQERAKESTELASRIENARRLLREEIPYQKEEEKETGEQRKAS